MPMRVPGATYRLRATMGRLLILTTTACAALVLAACGGDDGGDGDTAEGGAATGTETTDMSYDEWEAVELKSQRDDLVAQFGEPQDETDNEYTDTVSYTIELGSVMASFNFDPDSGELEKKVWSELTGEDGEISFADFDRVEHGMTEDELVADLGEPWERSDDVAVFNAGGEAFIGGNPPGTLQHCLEYTPPGEGSNATFCFDEPGGEVNWKFAIKNGETVKGSD
jgi:hypothetical protein